MRETHRLEYQPALDGVRALAVLAVVLFHAGTPGFGGGYLGVSLFFTLSGYLITSLLLQEHDASGTVDFRAFYGRRMRRLLPASVATVAAVVVIAAASDVFDGVVGLRTQVVGALLQVSNWVLLAGDTSYQDLLAQGSGAVSPLEHFWSLAIEEQFYWLWPPLVALLLTRVHARRTRVVGAVTLAAMAAAPVIAHVWGPDAAYWATPARLGEILVGAFLAFVLTGASLPKHVSLLAPVCLGALAAAVVLFPASSGPAYEGFLPLVAVVSGGLIVGLQADSRLRRALSLRPFVAVGMVSYGVYLVHWPVFVIVDADRTGLDGPMLTVVRLLITAVISIASYFLLERPIRLQRRVSFRVTAGAAAATSLAVIAVAVAIVPTGPTNYWQVETGALEAASIDADARPGALTVTPNGSTTTTPTTGTTTGLGAATTLPSEPTVTTPEPTATTTPLPELARPVRIVVTGDSTGDALGTGVVLWAASNPQLAQAEVHAALGCGFVMGGERRWGDEIVSTASCDGWPQTQLYPEVERTQPDVVTVMTSTWDIIDQRWDGGELLTPSDPEYRARLVTAYTQLVDDLVAAGAARVAFVREPVPNVWWNNSSEGESDPLRHQVLAEVYQEIAAAHPATVRVIDLASWYSGNELDADRDARPDGVHLAPDVATSIADRFLGQQLIAAALR